MMNREQEMPEEGLSADTVIEYVVQQIHWIHITDRMRSARLFCGSTVGDICRLSRNLDRQRR